MRKIIAIGECILDILFHDNTPVKAYPGGKLLNAAALLGETDKEVYYVAEAANDHVGNMVIDFLNKHKVNTRSIDRYTEGSTPSTLIFSYSDGLSRDRVYYGKYPQENFDTVWPRIDPDDIVIFGGYYSLDPRVRTRLFDIIKYAQERKAIVVYMPSLRPESVPRITRVMPSILENLEAANLVVTFNNDLPTIFGKDDAAKVYHDNIVFYSFNLLNIENKNRKVTFFSRKLVSSVETGEITDRLPWNAGAIAGIVDAIIANDITFDTMDCLDEDLMSQIVNNAKDWGDKSQLLSM